MVDLFQVNQFAAEFLIWQGRESRQRLLPFPEGTGASAMHKAKQIFQEKRLLQDVNVLGS